MIKKDTIYKIIPKSMKFYILRFWFLLNNPLLLFSLRRNSATSKTLLILSLPRSGSSWVGDILGSANNARYLREPITQTFHQKSQLRQTVFELNACSKKALYLKSIQAAFTGFPKFTSSIIANPKQWLGPNMPNTNKVRVIKEVNPLILDYILERYHPTVIYLVRHPAAVLNSYYTQGWRKNAFIKCFTEKRKLTLIQNFNLAEEHFWKRGATYHYLMQKLTLKALDGYDEKLIMTYEDICRNPSGRFDEMCSFAGLEFTAEMKEKVKKSSESSNNYQTGKYDLNRDSQTMISVWKNKISPENLNALKTAYLSYQPHFYQEDKWW